MLGKYADASSSSMINLENGLRNRVLYHQNMMGMNLMAEFYHNPLMNSSGSNGAGGSDAVGAGSMLSPSQKMLNILSVSAGSNLQPHHTGNSSVVSTVPVGSASTASSGSSQQSLVQLQCQLCQKYFISGAALAQHIKTHENDYLAREESGPSGGYSQQQSITSAPSLVTTVASSSKTSSPLLAQQSIKSEYIVRSTSSSSVPLPGGNQFPTAYGITKQFDCHICHKSFMTMMNLNLHMKIHEEFKPAVVSSLANPSGGSSGTVTSQAQKPLNIMSHHTSAGSTPQLQHSVNGSVVTTIALGAVPSTSSGTSQQALQCQICQKYFISGTALAQHIKTHDNDYLAREESGPGGSYSQQQSLTSAPSLATAVASSSKTSPPLLAQQSIKSEYIVRSGASSSSTVPVPGGNQFAPAYGITKQFDCHICHKSFMTMMNLNLHMKIHEELKQTAATHVYTHAPTLGATSAGTSSNDYHHHHQQHHNNYHNNPQQHISMVAATTIGTDGACQICHKTFSTVEQFTAHMKIHENEFRNRALYHSGSSNTIGPGVEGSVVVQSTPTTTDSFYSSTQSQPILAQQQTTAPQFDAMKGYRCPICHKMSSNIIEHIKQHEGQLMLGEGAASSRSGTTPPTPDVTSPAPEGLSYHPMNEDTQSSLEGDDSEGQTGEGADVRKHECLLCHKKFSSSGNLAIHIRVHSGEKPFKCSVCGKGFIQSNNLATHMKTHTGEKPYACTICGKNFSQSNNLKTHIRTHTGEKPYACTICGKRFNQKNNLTTHMRTHQLVCMVCGVQFMHPSDLANHMKFHNDEKPYICSVCNKVYLNLDELTEHMKKTHNQVKPYRCHICDKTFTQSNNLKTHIKTHIFQDPFKCQMCSRSFQKEDDYSQHMLVHTADKPYECTYCGKRFIQSNNLKTHVRTHTGEKPYRCTICAKHFNQKNNLNTHMRIHTGEKPFECTICDKRFNQSNNLNKHIKTHGQEKDTQQQQPQHAS
ncbi:zinc finger protein 271-like [Anopheles coustani]|uniref:zinc finger protein 271-like n=2 Tax=coustani group TaxID=59130 RepID=UPI002658B02F|nr:zinc finger protein 271-like [Anopheles coustani]